MRYQIQNRPAPRRAERDADRFPDQLTDDEAINDGQDPSNAFFTTTIKRFLKYDNPFLYASRDHRYVIDAVCTGQLYGILPSVVQSDNLLSSSNLTLSRSIQTSGLMSLAQRYPSSFKPPFKFLSSNKHSCRMPLSRRPRTSVHRTTALRKMVASMTIPTTPPLIWIGTPIMILHTMAAVTATKTGTMFAVDAPGLGMRLRRSRKYNRSMDWMKGRAIAITS
jgi:hypothetical protein